MSTKITSKNAIRLGGYEISANTPTEAQVLVFTSGKYVPTTLSSSNLGSANLTSADNARTFTLKAGGTSSQYLSILNDGGGVLQKFRGDNFIDIGSSTNSQSINLYLATGDKFKIYSGTDLRSILDHNYIYFTNVAGTGYSYYGREGADIYGAYGRLSFRNTLGQTIMALSNGGSAVELNYCYPANVTQVYWYGDSISFKPYVKFGAIGTATAGIQVVGSGSTSATTTALFQNSSSATSLEIKDDRTSIFGNISTSYIKLDPYGVAAFGILQFCAAGTTTAYNVYDSTNAERFRVETSGMVYAKRGSLSSYMNFNTSINLWAEGTSSSFHLVGTNGSNHTVYLGNDSSHGYAEIKNSSGVTQSRISGSGDSYFLNNLAVGAASASARFHAKGSGNTSGTNTAIFQNSSSSAALTIKDDLTSTFGGVVTAPQIINTPFTVSVSSNAGTVTRSYRNNNFTNSSASAMTITMSLTGALDGDMLMVRIFDFSAVAQTITWVNTENSSVTVPATSNGSTTLPLTVGFQYNSATSKWRCIGSV